MMKKAIVIVGLALGLSACAQQPPGIPRKPDASLPSECRYVGPVVACEFDLRDGTACLLTYGAYGGGVTCNWQ